MVSIISDQWRIASTLGIGSDEAPTSVRRTPSAVEHDDTSDDTVTSLSSSLSLATMTDTSANVSTVTKCNATEHAITDCLSEQLEHLTLYPDETDTVTEGCEDSSAFQTNGNGKRPKHFDLIPGVGDTVEVSGFGSELGRTEADRLNRRGPGGVQCPAIRTTQDGEAGVKYMRTTGSNHSHAYSVSSSEEFLPTSPYAPNESIQQLPTNIREINRLQATYARLDDNCVQPINGMASFSNSSGQRLTAREVLTSISQSAFLECPFPSSSSATNAHSNGVLSDSIQRPYTTVAHGSYNFMPTSHGAVTNINYYQSSHTAQPARATNKQLKGDICSGLTYVGSGRSNGASPLCRTSYSNTSVGNGPYNFTPSPADACNGISQLAGTAKTANTQYQGVAGSNLSSSSHVFFNGTTSGFSANDPYTLASNGRYCFIPSSVTAANDVCDSQLNAVSESGSVNMSSLGTPLSVSNSSINSCSNVPSSTLSVNYPCTAVGSDVYISAQPPYGAASYVDYHRSAVLSETPRITGAPPPADFGCANGSFPAFSTPHLHTTVSNGQHNFMASPCPAESNIDYNRSTAQSESARVTDIWLKGNLDSDGISSVYPMQVPNGANATTVDYGSSNFTSSPFAVPYNVCYMQSTALPVDTMVNKEPPTGNQRSPYPVVHGNFTSANSSQQYASSSVCNNRQRMDSSSHAVSNAGYNQLTALPEASIDTCTPMQGGFNPESSLLTSSTSQGASLGSSIQYHKTATKHVSYNSTAQSTASYGGSKALPETTKIVNTPLLEDFGPDLSSYVDSYCNDASPVSSLIYPTTTIDKESHNLMLLSSEASYDVACKGITTLPETIPVRIAYPQVQPLSSSASSTSASSIASMQYQSTTVGKDLRNSFTSPSSQTTFNSVHTSSTTLPEATRFTHTPMLEDLNSDFSFFTNASSQGTQPNSSMKDSKTTGNNDFYNSVSALPPAAFCGFTALDETSSKLIVNNPLLDDFNVGLSSLTAYCNGTSSLSSLISPTTTINNVSQNSMISPSTAAYVRYSGLTPMPETTTATNASPPSQPSSALSTPMSSTCASSDFSMHNPSTTVGKGHQNSVTSSAAFNAVYTRTTTRPETTGITPEAPIVDLFDLGPDLFDGFEQDYQPSASPGRSVADQFTLDVLDNSFSPMRALMHADQQYEIEGPKPVRRATTSSTSSVASTIYPEVVHLTLPSSSSRLSVNEQKSRSYGGGSFGYSTDCNNDFARPSAILLDSTFRVSELLSSDLLLQNKHGDTPLHKALINDDRKQIDELLHMYVRYGIIGDVVNMGNKLHQTPLSLAVITNNSSAVRQLLDNGADVNVLIYRHGQPIVRQQPLHFAASMGLEWLPILRHLLNHPSVKIDAHNSIGHSPLHCAVLCHGRRTSIGVPIDSTATIRELVAHGADICQRDGSCDKMPLHFAIELHDVALVLYILELAADSSRTCSSQWDRHDDFIRNMLNACDGTGNSALHMASSIGSQMEVDDRRKLIQLLLRRGADPSAKNREGQLPRELTRDQTIIGLLRGQSGGGGASGSVSRWRGSATTCN